MRRYWIQEQQLNNNVFKIDGELFHHIFDVCRQELGSQFELLCGTQKAYFVKVVEVQKKQALAQVLEERPIKPLPLPHVHIFLSLPRYQKMETILEKAVELGVSDIHPFVSDHSFVKNADSVPANKWARWQKIIESATQQSGRGDLLKIHKIKNLQDSLLEFNRQTKVLGLFAYEGEGGLPLKEYLKSHNTSFQNICLFIGSEGGFSEQEVLTFKQRNLQPITLGNQILRVETACLVLTSIIKYEFGAMS